MQAEAERRQRVQAMREALAEAEGGSAQRAQKLEEAQARVAALKVSPGRGLSIRASLAFYCYLPAGRRAFVCVLMSPLLNTCGWLCRTLRPQAQRSAVGREREALASKIQALEQRLVQTQSAAAAAAGQSSPQALLEKVGSGSGV